MRALIALILFLVSLLMAYISAHEGEPSKERRTTYWCLLALMFQQWFIFSLQS